MADSYDALLRTRLQQTGGNRDTWGGLLNSDTVNLLVKAIAGTKQITIAGTDYTLTTNNGSEDEARYAALELIGAPAAARNVIVPSVSHIYLVSNSTGQTITIKTSTGTGAAVLDGETVHVYCNGTDCAVSAPTPSTTAANANALGGVAAANWARLNAAQAFSGAQKFVPVDLTMGATVTPALASGNVFTGVLNANTTINSPTGIDGTNPQFFIMHLRQASSGGPYTLGFDAVFDFPDGSPTIGTVASSDLLMLCVSLPAISKIICFYTLDVDPSTTEDITFTENECNVDLFRRLGSPSGVVTVNATIAAGVVIRSDSALEAALDLSGGFTSGSTINLTNLGFVIGKGGRGADGGAAYNTNTADRDISIADTSAEAGGTAIKGAGSGVTINITNANGRIWGGGGGGGAAGGSIGGDSQAVSGGGGGGAGLGRGGRGKSVLRVPGAGSVSSTAGANGRLNLDGSAAGGAVGTNASSGTANFGTGGDGGDYGAAGTDGTGNTTNTQMQFPASTGGAAGKAVDVNSSTVNFVNGSGSPNVKGAVS